MLHKVVGRGSENEARHGHVLFAESVQPFALAVKQAPQDDLWEGQVEVGLSAASHTRILLDQEKKGIRASKRFHNNQFNIQLEC